MEDYSKGLPVIEGSNPLSVEDELKKMIDYFSKKQSVYNDFDCLCGKIDPRKFGKKIGLLISGTILTIFGLIFTIVMSVIPTGGGYGYSYGYSRPKTDKGAVVFGVVALIIGIILVIAFFARIAKRKKECSETMGDLRMAMQVLYQHYLGYENCPIDPEYTNPTNLNAILTIIKNGKVRNIREAVSTLLYESQKNNSKLFEQRNAVLSVLNKQRYEKMIYFYKSDFFSDAINSLNMESKFMSF